jgi:exopolysaccharide biosynthesis protein
MLTMGPSSKGRFILLLMVGLLAAIAPAAPMRMVSASTETIQWTPVARGVDYSLMPYPLTGRQRGHVLVTRVDPSAAIFRVYYRPGQRQTVQDWAVQMPSAVLIVNASYSQFGRRAIGLVVINNQVVTPATGRSDSGRFQVEGDRPLIGPLTTDHVDAMLASSQYVDGFEGYPLLIDQGQPLSSFARYDSGARARRTVIAQDNQGRVLVVMTSPIDLTEMSMADMVTWLQNSGLGVVSALNLDGGTSSQIYLWGSNVPPELKQGYVSVPVVLVAYPR